MTEHSEEHETLLPEILAAGDPREAFEGSELAGCDTCRRELEELLAVVTHLGATGDEVRSTIEDAAALEDGEGETRAEAELRAHLRRARAERGTRRWRRTALALAAAAAVLLLVWIVVPDGSSRNGSPENGPTLGSGAWEAALPVGEVDAFERFAWRGHELPGGWYDLTILATEPDGRTRTLVEQENLTETEWTPADEESREWPDRIRWRVYVYDSSGRHVDSLGAECWLRSP